MQAKLNLRSSMSTVTVAASLVGENWSLMNGKLGATLNAIHGCFFFFQECLSLSSSTHGHLQCARTVSILCTALTVTSPLSTTHFMAPFVPSVPWRIGECSGRATQHDLCFSAVPGTVASTHSTHWSSTPVTYRI